MLTTLEKYDGHMNIWIGNSSQKSELKVISWDQVMHDSYICHWDKYSIEIVLFFRSVKQAAQVIATSHLSHDSKLFILVYVYL